MTQKILQIIPAAKGTTIVEILDHNDESMINVCTVLCLALVEISEDDRDPYQDVFYLTHDGMLDGASEEISDSLKYTRHIFPTTEAAKQCSRNLIYSIRNRKKSRPEESPE